MSNKFTSDKKLLQVMTMNPTVALVKNPIQSLTYKKQHLKNVTHNVTFDARPSCRYVFIINHSTYCENNEFNINLKVVGS